MQQNRNLVLVFLLTFLLLFTWMQIRQRLWPTPQPTTNGTTSPGETAGKEENRANAPVLLPSVRETSEKDQIALGEDDQAFELNVRLDPKGASVALVVLPKFQAADWLGRPSWKKDAEGNPQLDEHGKKVPEPLTLVSSDNDRKSYYLYSFEPNEDQRAPLDTLGRVRWTVVKKDGRTVENDTIQVDEQSRKRQRVTFQTEIDGVRLTKTYSLVEGQYHLGLEVGLERLATGDPRRDAATLQFRYQLTGAHNLPVEGKWYTTIFRNALIGTEDSRHNIYRDFQDLRGIDQRGGGTAVDARQEGRFIRYAGVAVQYFASVLAVETDQQNQSFLVQARPSLERAVLRGTVQNVSIRPPRANKDEVKEPWTVLSAGSFDVLGEDGKTKMTFQVRPGDKGLLAGLHDGQRVAVIYEMSSRDSATAAPPRVALEVRTGDEAAATHAVWESDITVRVNTDNIDLKVGAPVVHKYELYNGPVKVSQLFYLQRDRAIDPAVIYHYLNDLHLNTLTDYHMQGWFGEFLSTVGWSSLVIWCTNLMHWVLGMLHSVILNYGLCIILLTVLVRGLMFPLSRKQALMSVKMQELAPEMKKLGEQYKDDPQGRQAAQMELFRKHGVNPLGGCWFMMLQMPIMIGLYCALQESILFRLGNFWPTWITNLAAPDMLLYWSQSIPWISRPEDYGSPTYLGPFLNILPLIAVTLMLIQQKMYTPPPADEQQEAQQKMMNFMMIFFGFMFYKMPAGLCVYFIASSLWGFAERRLLPKRKDAVPGGSALSLTTDGEGVAVSAPVTGSTTTVTTQAGIQPRSSNITTNTGGKVKNRAARKRKSERIRGDRGAAPEEPQPPEQQQGGVRGWLKTRRERLTNWWNDILEQARKK
jgi:YidC/Oxa1 family membrane protein insertase